MARRTSKETITVYVGEEEQEMPARFEVCPTCDGRGVQALHGIAIPMDEFREWDREDQETYLTGGYDTQCPCCEGRRVVLVPDFDKATEEQRAAYQEEINDRAEARREARNEALMLGEWD